jgi:hypothetical protein
MIALKTHKKLQHVSIHFQIILREPICSLLKLLIKTVRSQILVTVLMVLSSDFNKEHTSSLRMI